MCYRLKQSSLAKTEGLKTWVFNNQANIFHPMSARLRAKSQKKQGTEHNASHCHQSDNTSPSALYCTLVKHKC